MPEFPFSSEHAAPDEAHRPAVPLPRRPNTSESDGPDGVDEITEQLPLVGFGPAGWDSNRGDWPGFGAYIVARIIVLEQNRIVARIHGRTHDANVLEAEKQAWQNGRPGPFPTGEQPPL